MRAILIDPLTQEVREVQIKAELKEYYNVIGNGCNLVDCPLKFENGDALYIDDEGLYHENIGAFIMRDWDNPVMGRALIVGTDQEGNTVDAVTDIEEVKYNLMFLAHDLPQLNKYVKHLVG